MIGPDRCKALLTPMEKTMNSRLATIALLAVLMPINASAQVRYVAGKAYTGYDELKLCRTSGPSLPRAAVPKARTGRKANDSHGCSAAA